MMPTAPTLMRHATVTPGAGVSAAPAPSMRAIVGENIRLTCIVHRVSARTLADMLGYCPSTAYGIWRGTRKVSTEEVWTIAHAFNIPVEEFFVNHFDVESLSWIYENGINHG